jgi:hypothetical protein
MGRPPLMGPSGTLSTSRRAMRMLSRSSFDAHEVAREAVAVALDRDREVLDLVVDVIRRVAAQVVVDPAGPQQRAR